MANLKYLVSMGLFIFSASSCTSILSAQTMSTDGNKLIIDGTDDDDKVEVRVENGQVFVEIWDKRHPQSWKYGKAGITQVIFWGMGGDDSFTTQKTETHLAAKVFGGEGFDTATLHYLDGDHFVNSIESLYYSSFGGDTFTTLKKYLDGRTERRINWQDISQGQSPTCYLAGSLAAIAHSSELNGDHRYAYNIEYIGYNTKKLGQYNYKVCLYVPVIRGHEETNLDTIMENWDQIEGFNKRKVDVQFKRINQKREIKKEEDNLIPDENDLIPYIKARTLIAWPSIIQRAFLKTFQSTNGGNMLVTPAVLTGKKPEYYSDVLNDDVINKMVAALGKQAVKSKSTKPITIYGFVDDCGNVGARRKSVPGKNGKGRHALVVLEVIPERQEIIVFNPWGVPKKNEHNPNDNVIRIPYSELKNGKDWNSVVIFASPQSYDQN